MVYKIAKDLAPQYPSDILPQQIKEIPSNLEKIREGINSRLSIGDYPNPKVRTKLSGLILKNKMAATGVFSTFSKDFWWPSRAKGIIGRDLKFAGYVPHYKILTGNIFDLILKTRWPPRAFLCQS